MSPKTKRIKEDPQNSQSAACLPQLSDIHTLTNKNLAKFGDILATMCSKLLRL